MKRHDHLNNGRATDIESPARRAHLVYGSSLAIAAERLTFLSSVPSSSSYTMALDVLLPHASPIAVATKVRTTLLQSSIRTLKAHGHMDAYLARLEPAIRDEIVMTFAPGWLPIGHAVAHYKACDRLQLTDEELGIIGKAVGDQIHGTFAATLLRGASLAGMTPWTLMKNFDRLWGRLFFGGSVMVTRVGPKDVHVDMRGVSELAELHYFRVALCGVVRTSCKMAGSTTAYTKVRGWSTGSDRLVLHADWT